MDVKPQKNLTAEALMDLLDPKNPALLKAYGGVNGLAEKLEVEDLEHGLSGDQEEIERRQQKYGANRLPEKKLMHWIQFALEAVKDPMLIILLVCAVVSIVLGGATEMSMEGTYEGWAILIAVAIVVSVSATNDWQKQRQFKELQDQMKNNVEVTVVRGGKKTNVKTTDVVVGDILYVQTGDILPGDAVFISGENIKADEAAFTGESDLIHKGNPEVEPDVDPFFYAGSAIQDGEGLALCIAVGESSFNGKIMMAILNKDGGGADSSSSSSESESEEDDGKKKKKEDDEDEEELTSEELEALLPEERREYLLKQEEKKAKKAKSDKDGTPLEIKLEALAQLIGICGTVAAGSLFVALTIIYFVARSASNTDLTIDPGSHAVDVLHFIITAITIIVVAVPEGLPLAVTIALAYSMKKMMADNNLVRHLKACETMGGASNICTDKTGTLTLNLMRIVAGAVVGVKWKEGKEPEEFGFPELVFQSIALNTTVYYDENAEVKEAVIPGKKKQPKKKKAAPPEEDSELLEDDSSSKKKKKKRKGAWTGNKTELALVEFAEEKLKLDVRKIRKKYGKPIKTIPFSSERKRMSSVYQIAGNVRVFTKGAAEIILDRCTKFLDGDEVRAITDADKKSVLKSIGEFAKEALRVIALAYIDLPEEPDWTTFTEDNLVYVGIVGIKDPLRPSVPGAVADCQKAGIMVRMVTGDNLETAKNIAKNAGILTKHGLAIEGPQFRKLSDREIDRILPKLQVLARSSPLDKKLLVSALRRHDLVVAVTGDGTNDAPALSLADVGFSMGIAGTEVCKLASDIVLLDDNFASIVQAVLWGRNVYDGIRKFVQFQLTVNVVAVLTAYIGAIQDAVSGGAGESPLTPIQLLWVNLIMDTFAALALATDPPRRELLERRPYAKLESIINITMWKNVFGQSAYQLAISLLLLGAGGLFMGLDPYQGDQTTLVTTDPWCLQYMGPLRDASEAVDEGYDYWVRCTEHVNATESATTVASSASGVSYTYGDLMCQCLAEEVKKVQYTFIFNAFVWMQIFNELNCRRILDKEFNIFQGIHRNFLFLGILIGTALFQGLYVNTFGEFGGVTRINGKLWGWSILFGVISLPLGFLLKLLPYALPFLRVKEAPDVNTMVYVDDGEEPATSETSEKSSSSSSESGSERSGNDGWAHLKSAVDRHAVLTQMNQTAHTRAGQHFSAKKQLNIKIAHSGWN
jgi:Ca2+ transporting ATPase